MAAQRSMMLYMQMASRERVTAGELAEKLGVTIRTIYRDIDELRECGFVIHGTPRLGYTLADIGALPPLLLPAEELRAMIAGLQAVRNSSDADVVYGAKALLARLRKIVPPRSRPGLGLKG